MIYKIKLFFELINVKYFNVVVIIIFWILKIFWFVLDFNVDFVKWMFIGYIKKVMLIILIIVEGKMFINYKYMFILKIKVYLLLIKVIISYR